MDLIKNILHNKLEKAKAKVEAISQLLVENKISLDVLIDVAKLFKDANKANCIEAMEYATRIKPDLATSACLEFVTNCLLDKAPRAKWESAKVIGNIAHRFPKNLDHALNNLLINTEDSGTVVRWSAAFALGEIIKLNTPLNKELIPTVEAIIAREEKNSIQKIYLAALKKIKNSGI